MKTLVRTRAVVGLALAGLLVTLAGPGPSVAAGGASLSVTPGSSYVAGQKLTFTGSLGVAGVRKIHLEFDMGAGLWPDVEGFSTKTKSDGSFNFDFPAPGMWGIKLRVASGSVTTPAKTFDAVSQDLTLDLLTGGNQVLPALPFTIEVDTTPTLPHRPDLLQLPAFPGRDLTLQRRVGDGWAAVDGVLPTVTGLTGDGLFVVPGITSTQTYRVVEGDYTKNGNQIGWFPSFPFTVEVVDVLRPTHPARVAPQAAPRALSTLSTASLRAGDGATAGKTNLWGVSLWDFAWEYGESLTSRPARGSDLKGWWLDSSTGSGRVAKHNGQLTFDSQRNWSGPGDVGTTAATLRGNPMKYGRWETRLRIKRLEGGARDYRALIELVPDRAGDVRCGAQNITVADVPVDGSGFDIGVKARNGKQWSATRNTRIGDSAVAFAVEVSKKHITWFLNGKPVGTVRDKAAVSDVPMTLRLSLVGDGTKEMNHTQFHSDWQRGWSLNRGKLVTRGASLKRGTFSGGC